ncbi:unnamed protein product, partial [Didymodactylos carnosus]
MLESASTTDANTNQDAPAMKRSTSIFSRWIKRGENELDSLMQKSWGAPGTPTRELVMRYWIATRTKDHWESLYKNSPHEFKKYLRKGYMEPIPIEWVRTQKLAWQYPEFSYWETKGEKRLYYILNHALAPDGHRPRGALRPLNIARNCQEIIRRGNARNAQAVKLDPQKLRMYRSKYDVFQNDSETNSNEYSKQVNNIIYETRRHALNELAEGILAGTDHIETMLLLDVSSSMTWNPHQGILGPDGITRYHDQPANIVLVQSLVHRLLNHMIPRAQKQHPHQIGISTVTFSSNGRYVGQLASRNFAAESKNKIQLGGGTQVMQGWQTEKNTYFDQQRKQGHGRYDPVYGWQPTPGMPKLSLLVFLDGEAMDMDEFELELLGETWAYVTIVLVGMENCPHHHNHAIELQRVAENNPHVGFFDVHGRVCERMVVEDLLSSVYPVDAPNNEEILNPDF